MNAYNQRVGLTDRMDLESKDGEQRATPFFFDRYLYIYKYAHIRWKLGFMPRARLIIFRVFGATVSRRKRTEPVRDYYTRCMETKRER